jgi:hypothetical protein
VKNFHLPLPDQTYLDLRAEAEREDVPATSLARQAVEEWLRARRRAALDKEIAEFAAAAAGTEMDLNPDFEATGIDHWLKSDRR